MILKNKVAVIYGAGGSLGSEICRTLAGSGARVYLSGLHPGPLEQLAKGIRNAGGSAMVDLVDALDGQAIQNHLERVLQQAGKLDITYNATGCPIKQNIPLIDLDMEDYMRPLHFMMQTQFLTATAAGRIMKSQGSGVILTLTATPGGIGYPYTAGFAAACCALECFSRNLASELGYYGVRVVNIRSGGSPDSRVFREAIAQDPLGMRSILEKMEQDTMLKKLPRMADIARAALFLVSDQAEKITGVTLDLTGGTTSALNYRVPGFPSFGNQ